MSNYVPNTGDSDRRASTRLRGIVKGKTSRPAAPPPPFDANGFVLGELLGMYGGADGQFVPGTPGRTISRAGERAAVREGHSRAERDRASNYAFINADIQGRNPRIRENYERATADLRGNAAQRAIETRAALAAREQDAAVAAERLGLAVNPGATARAGEVAEGALGRVQSNAESWAGFNAGAAERAVERNTGVADAFAWQGNQQQQMLANTMMTLLAGLQDQYVGGSPGRMVGGMSNSERLRLLGMITGIGDEDFDREMDTTRLAQGTLWG